MLLIRVLLNLLNYFTAWRWLRECLREVAGDLLHLHRIATLLDNGLLNWLKKSIPFVKPGKFRLVSWSNNLINFVCFLNMTFHNYVFREQLFPYLFKSSCLPLVFSTLVLKYSFCLHCLHYIDKIFHLCVKRTRKNEPGSRASCFSRKSSPNVFTAFC